MSALTVISQHLDDPALGDPTVRTFVGHPRHLGPQRGEPRDLAVDLGEVPACDAVGEMAGRLRLGREPQ